MSTIWSPLPIPIRMSSRLPGSRTMSSFSALRDVAALPNRLQDAPRTPLHNRWQYFVQRSGHEHWCRQLRRRRRADFIDYDRTASRNNVYPPSEAAMTSRQVPAHSRLGTRQVLTVTTLRSGGTFTFFFAASGAHVAGDYSYLTGTTGPESFSYTCSWTEMEIKPQPRCQSMSCRRPRSALDLPESRCPGRVTVLNKASSLGTFSGGFTYSLRATRRLGLYFPPDGHLSTGANNLGTERVHTLQT